MRFPISGATLRIVMLAVFWGSNFALIAMSLEQYDPIQILISRLGIGGLTLLLIARARSVKLAPRSLWLKLGIIALVANVIPYFLFAWAERTVASNVAGFLNALTPIATYLIASLSTRKGISIVKLAALALGLAGVAILVEPWNADLSAQRAGQIAILVASLMYAIAYVLQGRLLETESVSLLGLAATQLIIATVISLPAMAFTSFEGIEYVSSASLALLVMGAIGTGFAYDLNYRILEESGPTKASTVLYLLPIVAGALGWALLNEAIKPNYLIGVPIILAGVWLVRRPD